MSARKPPRRRGLGVDDLADGGLWAKVAASVERKNRREPAIEEEPPAEPPAPARTNKATGRKPATAAPATSGRPSPPPPPPPAAPRPAMGLDRRTRQKLVRGNVAIDGRIDLHGLSVEQARLTLRQYLAAARAGGKRTVLVITGKGASPFTRHTLHGVDITDTPERQGRLRRALPQWLGEAEFAEMVAGYQPAHPRHGGGGAFYIRLRRNRDQTR